MNHYISQAMADCMDLIHASHSFGYRSVADIREYFEEGGEGEYVIERLVHSLRRAKAECIRVFGDDETRTLPYLERALQIAGNIAAVANRIQTTTV